MLVVGCWLLVAGYWLLVTGCSLLVARYWLLVTGYWLLVARCLLFAIVGIQVVRFTVHGFKGSKLVALRFSSYLFSSRPHPPEAKALNPVEDPRT